MTIGDITETQSLTVGGLLARRSAHTGDATALITDGDRLTYRDLEHRVRLATAFLRSKGVSQGDRVALLLRNGQSFCELFFAISRLGAICCPVNHRLEPAEVAYIVADCGARLLVFDPVFDNQIAQVQRGGLDAPECVPLTDDGNGDSYAEMVRYASDDCGEEARENGDGPLLLVYTSGTTGRPKGAVITDRQLLWSSFTIGYTVDFRLGDMHLLVAPMFHVGGLSFTVHAIHAGATLVMPSAWKAGEVLDLIQSHGVQHFFAVPTMLADLLDEPGYHPRLLESLRWVMSGAAPLSASLLKRFSDAGVPLLQSYGATETCGPATCVNVDRVLDKGQSVGIPFFHTDVRVANEMGGDAGVGEHGEIMVRAGHVFSGYWRNEEATSAAFSDGWFRTGDVGYRDNDGYLHLVDRKNNMIISGGENVYPREVEAVLERCAGVADVAVVGLPDEKWGEIVCAVVVPDEGQAPTLDDLTEHCTGHVARYKIPKRLVLRETLPKNATGKVQRGLLRDEIMEA